jgi:hypothetical protein
MTMIDKYVVTATRVASREAYLKRSEVYKKKKKKSEVCGGNPVEVERTSAV